MSPIINLGSPSSSRSVLVIRSARSPIRSTADLYDFT
jgi:hypothetical protein